MNKITKILSVVLVFVLALSVFVLPTSAATPNIKVDVEAEYQGKNTAGLDFYKFSVYIDSTLSLCAYQLNITYDNAVWQLLNAKTKNNQAAVLANMVIDKNDTNNILYTASDAYVNYGGGNWTWDGAPNGYVLMPGDGTNPTLAKISDDNMGATLKAAGYTGLYSPWAADATDDYLCISGGTLNGQNSPTSGRVMVMSWYMGIKDGTAPGNYEVGFNAAQAYRLTGTYTTEDAVGSLQIGTKKASITQDQVTYTNAIVSYGSSAPELSISHHKNQIRFNTDKDGKYANSFDYRIVSKVDNFDEVFASVEDGSAKIKDVGFVFTTGEYDVNAAKAQVEGGAVTYSQVKRCYLSTNGNAGANYAFACLVRGIADNETNRAATLKALGYIIYENASGDTAYAYYETTLDVGALYNANSSYIPA